MTKPFAIYRRLLAYAWPHWGTFAASGLCMAVLGLTTGAYAYLFGPALRFLLTGGAEGFGSTVLSGLRREQIAAWLPVLVVALGVLKGLAYLGQFYASGEFAQAVAQGVRRNLFGRLLALSPVQLARERAGDLLARLSGDVGAVEAAAMYALASYVRDGLQLAVFIVVAFLHDWRLALLLAVVLPLSALPVARLTRRVFQQVRKGQAQLGQLAGQLHEGLGGLRTIQAFNGQEAELRRFGAHARAHEEAIVRAGWARGAVPGLMEVFAAGALAAALAYAAVSRAVEPEALLSLLATVVLAYQPAKDLGRVSGIALQAAAAGERLFALLDARHLVPDGPGAVEAPRLVEGVRLEGVHFAYGSRPTLRGLTLEIPVGQVTALVGPSGAGKSTVAALLLRFGKPDSGRLLLDGVDAESLRAASVRAQFALVTQEPLLFAGSVEDNLRFARPEATRDEVEAAARVAQADDFIRALPQGYATPVGERGLSLSGGQRQRLCLARAVLAGAPVLVLDEATSALDPESEREVQAALGEVLRGRTALVIAHRLSTVVSADCIHFIEGGQVVESGTHAELLALRGRYAAMWRLQQEPVPSEATA